MNIVISTRGTQAIYEQIAGQIRKAIASGDLRAGESLPSIRALASEVEVSVITTKRAYEELEKEGLIRSVAGKGFYVCECNQDYLHEKELLEIERKTKQLIEAGRSMGMKKRDMLEMIEELWQEEQNGKE